MQHLSFAPQDEMEAVETRREQKSPVRAARPELVDLTCSVSWVVHERKDISAYWRWHL